MLARELIDAIGKRDLPNVLLFCPGTAPFNKEAWEPELANRAVDLLIAHYVDPSLRDLAFSAFYADETDAGHIVGEAQTLPFLAERRVIVVRNAERYLAMSGEKGSPLMPLIHYFKSPADFTLLIFVASKIDRRKKFFTACKEAGEIVECPQLTDGELESHIRSAAEKLGKRIGRDATAELLERAGGRLSDVNNALTLVATYVGSAAAITPEDVIAATADVAEETVWTLTDAIAASDVSKALKTLHQLLDMGKHPDELLGLIHWLFEQAYQASTHSTLQVKSKYVEKKVLPLAEKFSYAKLTKAMSLVTETQFLSRTTGTDKNLLIELLVTKFATPLPRRAKARRTA